MIQQNSLVVCKECEPNPDFLKQIKWMPVCDENTIYTIREVVKSWDPDIQGFTICVLFEEGVIGIEQNGMEFAFPIAFCIEVQPPMDIKALLEETLCETI